MFKRLLGSIFLACLISLPSFAVRTDVVTLDKSNIETPTLETGKINTSLQGSLLVNDSESLATLIDNQKEHDLKDLERLWQGTVENNQVIEFALKKLASPDSQTG